MKLLVKGRRPLHATIKYRGLDIAIENQQSSARAWKNPDDGTQGMSHMKVPYGYFRGSLGVDGDAVDVYVGPDRNADAVYIIHQTKAPDFTEYDEDKVMLCFPSAQAAKDAYLKQYNDPRFFGSMTEMPFDEFKEKLAATNDRPGMIKSLRKSGEAMCKKVGDSLGVDWNEVDLDEFCNGMFVEEEHKDVTHGDPKLTAKIVLAHLKERKDYYTQLEKVEKSVKSGLFLIRRL